MNHLRAHALRLPADHIRIGDYLTVGGHTGRVTFAEQRGGLTRLELDADTRLILRPTTHLTITRPAPPQPVVPRPVQPDRRPGESRGRERAPGSTRGRTG